jgi:hypothetical protein
MNKDESRRKAGQRGAPATPESGADSLDFSHIGPGESPAPVADAKPAGAKASRSRSASVVPAHKRIGSSARDEAGARRVVVPVLIIIAIGLMVTVLTTEHASQELATPEPSATPTPKAAQTYAPSPRVGAAPSSASTAQSTPARTLPDQFLKAFQEYAAKSGKKAMALALDSDGRSAYVGAYGYATQPAANEEALSECMRLRVQSGVQQNCRMYAVGDEVVWQGH